jgi:hypothetical protein
LAACSTMTVWSTPPSSWLSSTMLLRLPLPSRGSSTKSAVFTLKTCRCMCRRSGRNHEGKFVIGPRKEGELECCGMGQGDRWEVNGYAKGRNPLPDPPPNAGRYRTSAPFGRRGIYREFGCFGPQSSRKHPNIRFQCFMVLLLLAERAHTKHRSVDDRFYTKCPMLNQNPTEAGRPD